MGRHSSEQRAAFYRSLLAWAIPWIVIAAIVGVAVWFAVGALSGTEVTPENGPTGNGGDTPFAEASPSPSPTASPQPSRTPRPKKDAKDKDKESPEPGLITQDLSLQVLNGTGGMRGAADSMAKRLSSLGYEVVAVGDALTVDRTTVFWSGSENEAAARALAGRFGWFADAAPTNLSESVDVHVVVGPDEPPGNATK